MLAWRPNVLLALALILFAFSVNGQTDQADTNDDGTDNDDDQQQQGDQNDNDQQDGNDDDDGQQDDGTDKNDGDDDDDGNGGGGGAGDKDDDDDNNNNTDDDNGKDGDNDDNDNNDDGTKGDDNDGDDDGKDDDDDNGGGGRGNSNKGRGKGGGGRNNNKQNPNDDDDDDNNGNDDDKDDDDNDNGNNGGRGRNNGNNGGDDDDDDGGGGGKKRARGTVTETLRCQDKKGHFLPIATVCKDLESKSFCKKVFPKNTQNPSGRPLNCDLHGLEEVAYKCAHHCKICCEVAAHGCGDDPTYHINCENRKNLCHNMTEMMTSACAATCGFCNKGPCVDSINGCIGLRSMCRHHKEFGGELLKCSRTCGFCNAKCVDLSSDCALADRSACYRPPDSHPEENPYYEAMSKVCRKTCDLCHEPMPIDPDSTLDFPSSEENRSDDDDDDDDDDDVEDEGTRDY